MQVFPSKSSEFSGFLVIRVLYSVSSVPCLPPSPTSYRKRPLGTGLWNDRDDLSPPLPHAERRPPWSALALGIPPSGVRGGVPGPQLFSGPEVPASLSSCCFPQTPNFSGYPAVTQPSADLLTGVHGLPCPPLQIHTPPGRLQPSLTCTPLVCGSSLSTESPPLPGFTSKATHKSSLHWTPGLCSCHGTKLSSLCPTASQTWESAASELQTAGKPAPKFSHRYVTQELVMKLEVPDVSCFLS